MVGKDGRWVRRRRWPKPATIAKAKAAGQLARAAMLERVAYLAKLEGEADRGRKWMARTKRTTRMAKHHQELLAKAQRQRRMSHYLTCFKLPPCRWCTYYGINPRGPWAGLPP